MQTGIEAYPLTWPEGWARTKSRTTNNNFKTSFERARQRLSAELNRLGATNIVISTDVPLRRDGMPFATGVTRAGDPGVAVYFRYKQKDMVFACDKFTHLQDNMNAIALTIGAIRGIERWGASDMMERAFTGFKRLPERGVQPWLDVLELRDYSLTNSVTRSDVESAFAELVKRYHPDIPGTGDRDKFERIVEARSVALREVAA